VERWFGHLTGRMIRRGVHKSVQALEVGIRAWIENWNQDPRPFTWTKTAEEILDSLAKYSLHFRRATLKIFNAGGYRTGGHRGAVLCRGDEVSRWRWADRG